MIRPKERPEGLKPVGGDSPKASDRTKSGSGGKGGRKDVNPSTKTGKSAITRSRGGGFGYYDDRGKYVSAFTDAFDGGGANQSGTYFAGGPLSNILNVMKVAPKGSGDVPRERIGYRDLADMFDQGGPQASGGGFRGASGFSGLGNIANMLTGNQSERVGYYDEGGRFYEPPAPVPSGVLGSGQSNDVPLQNYESTGRQMQTMGLPNYESTGRQMLQMIQGPRDYRSQYVSEAVSDAYRREMALAEAEGRPTGAGSQANARSVAQGRMAYPQAEMPNINLLMPPNRTAQMPVQQENLGSLTEQPTGQMRQAATGLTYAPPTSSAEVDFMKSELLKEGYIVDGYGDSDIKELYKLFVQ